MSNYLNKSFSIVIIGSGLAGYTLIREIRKLDKSVSIALVTRDPGYFYSKPMLSTAIASNKHAVDLISSSSEDMSNQFSIEIFSETEVTAISSSAKAIQTNRGLISYENLVIAVGADQASLSLHGNAKDKLLMVNDLEDYIKFRDAITNKKRVSIIGAGLIGCEFANDLILGGYEVDLINRGPQILGGLLPDLESKFLQQTLSAAGIKFHLDTTAVSINHSDQGLLLTLANDEVIATDVVLSAVGLKPRLEIAQAAGIETGVGIMVNRVLETSLSNIYAIGDCAEVEGLILSYVMPIMQAARALALSLTGQRTELAYPAMPIVVKTPALPTIVAQPAEGVAGTWRNVPVEEGGYLSRFESIDGDLLGFTLMGSATSQRGELTKQLPAILA